VLSPDAGRRHADGAALARDLSLCLNPGGWDLLKETGHGWQKLFRRWPLIALVPVNLLPFIVAAAFNWYFNHETIIWRSSLGAKAAFYTLSFYINGILFPVGTALIIWYLLPVGAAVRAIDLGRKPPEETYEEARRRVFWIGHVIATIGVACWVIAGAVFPIGLSQMSDGFPPHGFFWFLLSQGTCGLVSAGFPFLASTWVAVRVFYPTLLGDSTPTDQERKRLLMLPRHANVSLTTAALVPLFAAGTMIAMQLEGENKVQVTVASLVFLVASALVFVVAAFGIVPRIRRDVIALAAATRSPDEFGTVTDSVEF
jgi:eukaryotic-like serine/threonine-protein kinase